jgi:hypothetical protein
VAGQLVVLYWPGPVSGAELFPGVDKVVHVLVFAAAAGTGVVAGVPVRWLVAALAANAVVSELVQHYLLTDRSGDPRDVAADVVGIAVGTVVAVAMVRPGGTWGHDRLGGAQRPDGSAARGDSGPG